MDLNQLANLGEFIGGVAVLVTLIYLAAQVRSGARERKASSMREATREMGSCHVWTGFMMQLRDIAAYPGIQAWWKTRSHWYGEGFRAFVQTQMGADNQPSMYGEQAAGERDS